MQRTFISLGPATLDGHPYRTREEIRKKSQLSSFKVGKRLAAPPTPHDTRAAALCRQMRRQRPFNRRPRQWIALLFSSVLSTMRGAGGRQLTGLHRELNGFERLVQSLEQAEKPILEATLPHSFSPLSKKARLRHEQHLSLSASAGLELMGDQRGEALAP
ncbi:hypothetical protein C8R47DRAFT_155811 [Mycena vitilis]|nr:hypothetical protein C8R47DRAFT_155811 [Mycena vitilis]